MDLQVSNANVVSEFCRQILSDILDELVNQVPDGLTSNTDKVQQSLRNISNLYKTGLRYASSDFRSDWNDPANRCAYVFVYLMQHCYLVNGSLQYSDVVAKSWRNKSNLKVCSIGGGPGSDLVGVTIFLRENRIFPPSLECLVLDLYPTWKDTWDTIYHHLPESFTVNYRECDLVRDTKLRSQDLQFVKRADILTLSKSFSAVAAFFRQDRSSGNFLRDILREAKPGCFVLYIDNDYESGCTEFQQNFASPAGLALVFQFRGKPTLPKGEYSFPIRKYCRLFDFSPMRNCEVVIQLFRKKGSIESVLAIRDENNPTGNKLARIASKQTAVPQTRPSVTVANPLWGICSSQAVTSASSSSRRMDMTPQVSTTQSITAHPNYNRPAYTNFYQLYGISSSAQEPPRSTITRSVGHKSPTDPRDIRISASPSNPKPTRESKRELSPLGPLTQTPSGETRRHRPVHVSTTSLRTTNSGRHGASRQNYNDEVKVRMCCPACSIL